MEAYVQWNTGLQRKDLGGKDGGLTFSGEDKAAVHDGQKRTSHDQWRSYYLGGALPGFARIEALGTLCLG